MKKIFCAATLLALCAAAQAQSAGSWSVRAGAVHVKPVISSDDLTRPSLPGTKIDSGTDTELYGGVNYAITDHWSVDVPLATPIRLDIIGAGAVAGVGKVAEIRALPITVLAQYYFRPQDAKLRPYLGIGPTYTVIYHERSTGTASALTGGTPTTVDVDSNPGVTVQVGLSVKLTDRVFLDAGIAKLFLTTTTHLSTGQSVKAKLDPVLTAVSLGYRF